MEDHPQLKAIAFETAISRWYHRREMMDQMTIKEYEDPFSGCPVITAFFIESIPFRKHSILPGGPEYIHAKALNKNQPGIYARLIFMRDGPLSLPAPTSGWFPSRHPPGIRIQVR